MRNPRLIRDALFRSELDKLNADFTESEVSNTLQTFARAKSHGLGIHTRLLGIAWPGLSAFVVWFVTRCLRVGHFANIHKIAVSKPCLKKGKDPLSFESCRQITLLDITEAVRAMYCSRGLLNALWTKKCMFMPFLWTSKAVIQMCSTTFSSSGFARILESLATCSTSLRTCSRTHGQRRLSINAALRG